jgi:curved DNA-binding protein CbpA
MQLKDHYKTLGVRPSSDQSEIKKAYRVLAVKYHPDKNPGSELCEAQFKEVNEAYSILSDSRKRAHYDDERWLSGVGSKTTYTEAVTPAWILKICVELNASLAAMDTHRMSQQTLQTYMLMILTDAHLGILQREDDKQTNKSIIQELLKAASRLEIHYLDAILKGLDVVAGNDDETKQNIAAYATAREKQARKEKLFPYIVIVITIGLCLFMYFYGSIR